MLPVAPVGALADSARAQITAANTTLLGTHCFALLKTCGTANSPTSISCSWAGADTSDGSQFYYNSDVVQIFKDYITVLLNHTNQYTGVSLLDFITYSLVS